MSFKIYFKQTNSLGVEILYNIYIYIYITENLYISYTEEHELDNVCVRVRVKVIIRMRLCPVLL